MNSDLPQFLSVMNGPGFLQGESDYSGNIARGLKDLVGLVLLLVCISSVGEVWYEGMLFCKPAAG